MGNPTLFSLLVLVFALHSTWADIGQFDPDLLSKVTTSSKNVVVDINVETFDDIVLRNEASGFMILFTKEDLKGSQGSTVAAAAAEFKNAANRGVPLGVMWGKVNIEGFAGDGPYQELLARYSIKSVPTVKFFKQGKIYTFDPTSNFASESFTKFANGDYKDYQDVAFEDMSFVSQMFTIFNKISLEFDMMIENAQLATITTMTGSGLFGLYTGNFFISFLMSAGRKSQKARKDKRREEKRDKKIKEELESLIGGSDVTSTTSNENVEVNEEQTGETDE